MRGKLTPLMLTDTSVFLVAVESLFYAAASFPVGRLFCQILKYNQSRAIAFVF